MKKIIITLSFLIAILSFSNAQDMSRRQHVKFAKKMLKTNNLLDAAVHFEKAASAKPDDDLFFEAGYNYASARDYASALRCFSKIKDESSFDDLYMLKGRILKNLGKYEDAIQSFSTFLSTYDKKDKVKKENIVSTEIKGCELALEEGNSAYSIEPLSENINSPEENEFAAFQVGDYLYFSSTLGDFMNVYRSELEEGNWLFSVIPQNFNQLQGQNFCNGSFAKDLTKFYFNICETNNYAQSDCSIYLIENEDGNWSDPKKLPENINALGTTNIHPVSDVKDGKEYLYFSSNRPNGQGGLDLWYVTRTVGADYTTFSAPRNLGPKINTTRDEISPFYTNGTLYFSSNGQPSLGGFDIFESKGMAFKWSVAKNVGSPLNSSADDTHFFQTDDNKYGYITSNRGGFGKASSTDDDIFSFHPSSANYSFSGNVFDKSSNVPLDDISVTVYEKNGGNQNLLTSQDFPDGNFNLGLLPNKELFLSISKPGYTSETLTITTFSNDATHQEQSIYLNMETVDYTASVASTNPSFSTEVVEERVVNNSTINENITSEVVVSTPTYTEVESTTSYNTTAEIPSYESSIEKSSTVYVPTVATTTEALPTRIISYEPSIQSAPSISTTTIANDNLPRVIKSYEPSIQSAPSTSPTLITSEGMPTVIRSYEPAIQGSAIITGSSLAPSNEVLPQSIKSYEPELSTLTQNQNTNTEYINDSNQFNYDGAVYTTRSKTKYEPGAFSSAATKHSGVYFKVQLMATKNFDPSASRFNSVNNLGELDTEYLYEKELTRVLLSHFISLSDAKDVRDYARKNGFKGAFVVKYENGQRLGQHF